MYEYLLNLFDYFVLFFNTSRVLKLGKLYLAKNQKTKNKKQNHVC